MSGRLVTGSALLLLVLGCGAALPSTDPDAMSAEAHRREAADQAREARTHAKQYDPDASERLYERYYGPYPYGGFNYGYSGTREEDFYWGATIYNPTQSHLREAGEHRTEAAAHLNAAKVLEEFETAQCKAFPPETRVFCPLIGQVEAVEDIFGGVRMTFTEDVNVNAAVAHMRCHLAFARARGNEGMEACPLYLRGIRVDRVQHSRSVDVTVGDNDDLDALRSRTRAHLRSSASGD